VSAIFLVQEVYGMKGRTTSGKEVEDKGVGLFGDKKADSVVNSVEGFGKIETVTDDSI